jgi:hypothetical protein
MKNLNNTTITQPPININHIMAKIEKKLINKKPLTSLIAIFSYLNQL